MTQYRVRWEIDVDADSPKAAALRALTIQRDPTSHATLFTVWANDYQCPDDAVLVDLIHESTEQAHPAHGDNE